MNTEFASPDTVAPPGTLTVSQLNRAVAGLLERSIAFVRVEGELSNVVRAASGHWYFLLKDPDAQVRCVMFRGRARHVDFVPRDGDRVEVRAQAGLYEARGEFQLNVEALRRAGAGDLWRRFQQLKETLQREGLFERARKRPLPHAPTAIGIVTSPQAAALRDVLATLRRRAPGTSVIVYPTPVQGSEAPALVAAAIAQAAQRRECDVLLLVRGGGSIEDLWAFNDERVARAIAACRLPVISGIGHETDFTIADFVADLRAPTPTAAAELVAPDRRERARALERLVQRLQASVERRLDRSAQRLDTAARLLRPPAEQWRERAQRVSALARRLVAAHAAQTLRRRSAAERLAGRLRAPRTELPAQALDALAHRLQAAMREQRARAAGRLDAAAANLALVDPQAVLDRGYAIVRDHRGRIVRRPAEVAPGQPIAIRLAGGEIGATVDSG